MKLSKWIFIYLMPKAIIFELKAIYMENFLKHLTIALHASLLMFQSTSLKNH